MWTKQMPTLYNLTFATPGKEEVLTNEDNKSFVSIEKVFFSDLWCQVIKKLNCWVYIFVPCNYNLIRTAHVFYEITEPF